MTANTIAALRLQEEKRHNQSMEGLEDKSQKRALAGNLAGALFRGLGTGIISSLDGRRDRLSTYASMRPKERRK